MGRTVNRNPLSVDVNSLDEQYFNFAEFKGINHNKNYITIDQQSFEEALNVFVDQDSQLSTRPITKQINILPADEVIINVFNVNNLTIYHTKSSSGIYRIRFYINRWYDHQVTEHVNITWYKDKYILFEENNIEAWSYDFSVVDDKNALTWYTIDEIVYIPINKIITGNTTTEFEADNIFTDAKIIRYDFESDMLTITDGLEGKIVTIKIDNELFKNIEWVKNNEIIFTKPLGSKVVNRFEAKAINSSSNIYRYFGYNIDDSGNCTDLCISLDGILFINIPTFEAVYSCAFVMSDDAKRIFAYTTNTSGYTWDGLWYFEIPDNAADINTTIWNHVFVDFNDLPFEANKASSGNNNSSRLIMQPVGYSLMYNCAHSPDSNNVVFVCGMQVKWKNFANQGLIWVNPDSPGSGGTFTSGTFDAVGIVICTYTGSSWKIQLLPMEQIISGKFGTAANKVRFTITNTSSNYITYYQEKESSGMYTLTPYFIRLKSDNTPYMAIQFDSTKGCVIPVILKYAPINVNSSIVVADNNSPYAYDVYQNWNITEASLQFKVAYHGTHSLSTYDADNTWFVTLYDWSSIRNYDNADYVYKYIYSSTAYNDGNRNTYPIEFDIRYNSTEISKDIASKYFKVPSILSDDKVILTDKYFVYNNVPIKLLNRNNSDNLPLWVSDDYQKFAYQKLDDGTIYSNAYSGHVYVDYVESGTYNYLIPEHIADLIDKVFSFSNKIYWSTAVFENDESKRTFDQAMLYISKDNVEEFEDIVTNMIVFSQTSLGIFLSNSVYEFQYSETLTNNFSKNMYLLTPTKLQLGCVNGSDIIIAYNSSQILITNIKGLTTLTYQDFVQSTEQVFTYLTDNIMNDYYEWVKGPIKLHQYKDWIFMYQQTETQFYVLDVRNMSWWKWETIYPIQYFVNVDSKLYIVMNGVLYEFVFDADSILDNDLVPVTWKLTSQKLHFNAPNNYKHIRSLSIITTQNTDSMRFKLEFTNYRNLNNLTDNYIVEYDIDEVSTVIKRVNFVKANAFQFTIMNDSTDRYPIKFVTPDIAIKYRITERVR